MICVNFLIIDFLIGAPGELLIHDVTPLPRREAALRLCPETRMVSAFRLSGRWGLAGRTLLHLEVYAPRMHR